MQCNFGGTVRLKSGFFSRNFLQVTETDPTGSSTASEHTKQQDSLPFIAEKPATARAAQDETCQYEHPKRTTGDQR